MFGVQGYKSFLILSLTTLLAACSNDVITTEPKANGSSNLSTSQLEALIAANPNLKGEKGDRGEPGLVGANGADGHDGAPGANGADGHDGINGAPGANGHDGIPGAMGPQGPIGATGPMGPQGPQGPAGNFAGLNAPKKLEWENSGLGPVLKNPTDGLIFVSLRVTFGVSSRNSDMMIFDVQSSFSEESPDLISIDEIWIGGAQVSPKFPYVQQSVGAWLGKGGYITIPTDRSPVAAVKDIKAIYYEAAR